jgi:hypothetical protein
MMSVPWFSFLLATTAAPKAVLPQGSPQCGIDHTSKVAERELQFDHTFSDSRERKSTSQS